MRAVNVKTEQHYHNYACNYNNDKTNNVFVSFLVVEMRLYTLPRQSVGQSVTFLNGEQFLHCCPCPTVSWCCVFGLVLHSGQKEQKMLPKDEFDPTTLSKQVECHASKL